MYLFILESIGTQELIFIAIVALIIFGPRKLPQLMKTAGKTMAELRSATNEFKTTWEKEATLYENSSGEKSINLIENSETAHTTTAKNSPPNLTENQLQPPEVKALSAEEFSKNFPDKKISIEENRPTETKAEKITSEKQNWL